MINFVETRRMEYLRLGFDHISDINGYDHILFLVALVVVFVPQNWRRILLLVTAFTLGHSLTLLLAALEIITPKAEFIEFLIPVTIFLTCVFNFFIRHKGQERRLFMTHFALASIFGLVHGMGFSNFFRETAAPGDHWIWRLLEFNIGLEMGQLILVGGILSVTWLAVKVLKIKHPAWILVVSGVTAINAVYLMVENKIW